MIALTGITAQSKIYESSTSLVYRGVRNDDRRAIIIKLLKQNYPSSQELTCYRQEYEITRSLNVEGVVKAYSQQDYQRTLIIFWKTLVVNLSNGGCAIAQVSVRCP